MLAPVLAQLTQDFGGAKMHFNHFVKLHNHKSVNKESLLLLMSRGAGILCANYHSLIDMIIVFLLSGTKLHTDYLGLILYQVKNDSKSTDEPQPGQFAAMDPYVTGILEAGNAAVPLIRIFALAAEKPCLKVTRHPQSSSYGAVVYDIWCTRGLPHEIPNPIQRDADIWDGLLQALYRW
jgi:hypothetical protein